VCLLGVKRYVHREKREVLLSNSFLWWGRCRKALLSLLFSGTRKGGIPSGASESIGGAVGGLRVEEVIFRGRDVRWK